MESAEGAAANASTEEEQQNKAGPRAKYRQVENEKGQEHEKKKEQDKETQGGICFARRGFFATETPGEDTGKPGEAAREREAEQE